MKIKWKQETDECRLDNDIKGIDPFGVLELHRSTREDLTNIVYDQGIECVKLRKRVEKLEVTPNPLRLFLNNLSILYPINCMAYTSKSL